MYRNMNKWNAARAEWFKTEAGKAWRKAWRKTPTGQASRAREMARRKERRLRSSRIRAARLALFERLCGQGMTDSELAKALREQSRDLGIDAPASNA